MPNKRTTQTFVCSLCSHPFERAVWHLTNVPLYCSDVCRRDARAARRQPIEQRFWAKVNKDGPVLRPELGPCWIWTAATVQGYGVLRIDGRNQRAHVIAYRLATGHEPAPETPEITHLCDGGNIGCVRPSHLMADTHAGNMKGMVERGRSAQGNRNGTRIRPEAIRRGERCPAAKLTELQVRTMRRHYAAGGVSQRSLAVEYGVSQSLMGKILTRKTWAHIV